MITLYKYEDMKLIIDTIESNNQFKVPPAGHM